MWQEVPNSCRGIEIESLMKKVSINKSKNYLNIFEPSLNEIQFPQSHTIILYKLFQKYKNEWEVSLPLSLH